MFWRWMPFLSQGLALKRDVFRVAPERRVICGCWGLSHSRRIFILRPGLGPVGLWPYGPWPLATKKISSSVGRAEKAAHMWAVP